MFSDRFLTFSIKYLQNFDNIREWHFGNYVRCELWEQARIIHLQSAIMVQ